MVNGSALYRRLIQTGVSGSNPLQIHCAEDFVVVTPKEWEQPKESESIGSLMLKFVGNVETWWGV